MVSKTQIKSALLDLLEKKIDSVQVELTAIRDSANSETKSSMGDKYETSREMMTQEQNRLGAQLNLLVDQLNACTMIDTDKIFTEVSYGCLVQTDKSHFFLSVAVGQITVNGQSFFAISGEAPIAKAMVGKKVGEPFTFNKITQNIERIQ
ncbi:GreA/GreB family elongation factor [Ekhidna sp.]